MRTRWLRRLVVGLAATVGLLGALALATGEVQLVTTHGVSMLPRFHTGDLAVVVPGAPYTVGEIVAYHNPLLQAVVLHRIVAEHHGLFSFKGDNNRYRDPLSLPASDIAGRLVARVPDGGAVLAWLRSPVGLGVLVVGAVLAGGLIVAGREQAIGSARRRKAARTSTPSAPVAGEAPGRRRGEPRTAVSARPQRGAADRRRHARAQPVPVGWVPVSLCLVLVAASAGLLFLSLSRPVSTTADQHVAYTQSMRFSYSGTAPAGVTYPGGRVRTGDPVFLALVDQLDVAARYRVEPAAGGVLAGASGTVSMVAELDGPGGWHGRLVSTGPVAFTGGGTTVHLAIPLAQIADLQQSFTSETGVALGSASLVVTPSVRFGATLDGEPLRSSFSPSLPLEAAPQQLNLVATTSPSGAQSFPQLFDQSHGSVDRPVAAPAEVTVLGRTLTVARARSLAAALSALSLVLLLGSSVRALRRRRMDETDRIRAQYGTDLVSVVSSPDPDGDLAVEVASIGALARLAARYDAVLMEYEHGAGSAYYVEAGGALYRYSVDEPPPDNVRPLSVPVARSSGPVDGLLLGRRVTRL